MQPEEVLPYDIAIGLARECRFGNHTTRFYSVAEHSIWCMNKGFELFPGDNDLHVKLLLHDAHEAYLGDWPTPVVDAIDAQYGGFKEVVLNIKRQVQQVIDVRFGIRNTMDDDRVKAIDRLALEWEFDMKVCEWTGFPSMQDGAVADMWLNYLKQLVKVPIYIAS